MALEGLVSERGSLKEVFPIFNPDTIQHSREITAERRDNKELRNQWFWTADHSLYRVEEKEAVLYLGNRETNTIFKNIDEACEQLIQTDNYRLNDKDIRAVVDSETTLRVELSKLDLKGNDNEYRYFEIDTKNYDKLNKDQRKTAEKVYGYGNDFKENMKMFNEAGVSKTRIYVLNPEYVKKHSGKGIARACCLNDFSSNSFFNASSRIVNSNFGALRGVPKSAAEGDSAPEIDYRGIANTLVNPEFNPDKLSEELNPGSATALSQALTSYITRKQ